MTCYTNTVMTSFEKSRNYNCCLVLGIHGNACSCYIRCVAGAFSITKINDDRNLKDVFLNREEFQR